MYQSPAASVDTFQQQSQRTTNPPSTNIDAGQLFGSPSATTSNKCSTMYVSEYEAQADTINVDNIATDSNNRIVLMQIKRNDANDDQINELCIQNHHDDEWEADCVYYCPEGAYDMQWLGYFIGKSDHLRRLFIYSFTPTSEATVRDDIEPFFTGISSNKSIQEIFFSGVDLFGGEIFTMLTPFFDNNYNLTTIIIIECVWGDEGARLFALALGSSTNKSLQNLDLQNNNIVEEGMVDIITALSMYPHLQQLYFEGNHLRNNGCVALATLLRCSATELEYLNISRNEIGDEGIEALVPALANCSHLERLFLSNNPSITTRGWQSLATILEAPNSNLKELFIARNNNVDDEVAAAFANALANNRTLHTLGMTNNPITAVGWEAFSKLLCDTSGVNATFLSNHTLRYVGHEQQENAIIEPLLELNRRDDKKEVATIKILHNHEDFDMQPFFEWEFKFLPLALGWLERASSTPLPRDFEPNIEPSKLSTIYQFVRGMPLLYVEIRLRKELEDIKATESQMEEEQLNLHQEFKQRLQFLQERKALLEERKKSIMRKIGKPNLN